MVFVIDEKPHPRFRRDGNDLIMNHRLALADALCGTIVIVETLDGRKLEVSVPEVIQPGYTKIVK
jgi:DnaJ family protein B protein 4